MPLSDSMEKLPTADRTAGPIAVFSNSYARLPEHFYARLSPTPVAKPRLIIFNESLASELGVDTRGTRTGGVGSGVCRQCHPPGGEPIAMAYAGHKFGNFVPQLGDGRAILLGEGAYGPCLRTPQPTTVGSRGGDRVWPLRSLNPTHALRP